MSLVSLIVVLVVVGVLLWAVNKFLGPMMDARILNILNVVVVIAVVLWLLQAFGILHMADNVRIGR